MGLTVRARSAELAPRQPELMLLGVDAAGSRASSAGGNEPVGAAGEGAESAHGGEDSSQAWVTSVAHWGEVVDAGFSKPACTIYEALPGEAQFPPLHWDACGADCAMADVVQGYGEAGALPFASTVVIDKDSAALLTLTVSLKLDSRWQQLRRVVRLDSGVTVGALRAEYSSTLTTSPCSFGGPAESAAAVDIVGGNQGDPKGTLFHLDGFAPLGGGSWTWASPAVLLKDVPGSLMGFDVDLPQRLLLLIGAGAVYKQTATTSSEYEPLESPSASYLGAGQGDLGVWNDLTHVGQPRIRGWAPDGQGVRTLVEQPPPESCNVVVSPSAVVAVSLNGKAPLFNACSGPANSAHLWRSPRAYVAKDFSVAEGPSLPGTPFIVGGLKTWGDFAALYVRPVTYVASDYELSGGPYLIVVELSTWKSWRVDATEGHAIQSSSFTLTADALYAGETSPGANGSALIQRVLRFPLNALDSSGTPL